MVSRIEKIRRDRDDDEYEPDLPPVGAAGYLAGYLWEIGPTMAGGAGPGPITHTEIRAWQELTGISLHPWEARFLRRLSREYSGELHAAEKPDRKAPWQPVDVVPDHSAVARDLRKSLRKLTSL